MTTTHPKHYAPYIGGRIAYPQSDSENCGSRPTTNPESLQDWWNRSTALEQLKYLAELGPIPRLVVDERPPLATKVILISKYGVAHLGIYDKTDRTIAAWCPLPKLTPDQKRRLMAMEAAGINPTLPPGYPPASESSEATGSWSCVQRSASPPSSEGPAQRTATLPHDEGCETPHPASRPPGAMPEIDASPSLDGC